MVTCDRKMRLILTVSVLITSAMITSGEALVKMQPSCEQRTNSMLMSPDDAWVALVHDNICTDGAFVTIAPYTVQLVRSNTAESTAWVWRPGVLKHDNDILSVEGGQPEYRPITRWLSPNRLQIILPNNSVIGFQKDKYEDIEIMIKFEPDDPAAREQFLKRLWVIPK